MGLRGPPKKPLQLESAQGFPGKRKRPNNNQQVAKSDEQPQASDSRFVPPDPPSHLWRKAHRDIWHELTGNPTTQLWFKRSDNNSIARYCILEANYRALVRKDPKPTYKTSNTNGDEVIKPNPEHGAMLSLARELRALEAQLGATPVARLNLVSKIGRADHNPAPPAQVNPNQTDPVASASQTAQPSPIGLLKTAATPPPGSKPN